MISSSLLKEKNSRPMKYRTIKIVLIALLSVITLNVNGQTLRSGQWLERMPYRHQLNPALMNDYGYFAFPVLGNFNVGVQSNVGLSTFLYPRGTDGELITFLDKRVSAGEFLDKLSSTNQLNFDISMPIISFGFFAFGGYNTFGVDFRTSVSTSLPYDLFAFLKLGMDKAEGSSYDASNLHLKANAYASVSIGHARPITDKLTVGVTLKALIGGANAKLNVSDLKINLSEDAWRIKSNAELFIGGSGITFETTDSGYVDGLKYSFDGVGGFGLGADIGATYQLLDNLQLSLAITDLGFIRWSNSLHATTRNEEFYFDGFDNIGGDDDDNSLENQMDDMIDDLEDMIRVYPGHSQSSTSYLNAVLRAGAEYSILKNKISFGVLSTTRFAGKGTWTEFMGSVNLKPVKWFNVAVTGALSNFGPSWGWVLNICPRGFNFFVGMDYMFTKVSKQYIPINNANANVNFGINFPMTRNPKYKKPKDKKVDDAYVESKSDEVATRGLKVDLITDTVKPEEVTPDSMSLSGKVLRMKLDDDDFPMGTDNNHILKLPITDDDFPATTKNLNAQDTSVTRLPISDDDEYIPVLSKPSPSSSSSHVTRMPIKDDM